MNTERLLDEDDLEAFGVQLSEQNNNILKSAIAFNAKRVIPEYRDLHPQREQELARIFIDLRKPTWLGTETDLESECRIFVKTILTRHKAQQGSLGEPLAP